MRKETIWVIVPVYNAEKTLHQCIRSIQKQTYPHWKLVLIDDGSRDRSGQLCDQYAAKDPRIQAIHTENHGPGHARTVGMERVDEDAYCVFCDSDDTLPATALEVLHDEATKSQADLVCGMMQRTLHGIVIKGSTPNTSQQNARIYDSESIMEDLYQSCLGGGGFPMSLCGKLYKVTLIRAAMQNVVHAPTHFAEDLNITMHLLPLVKRLSIIDYPVYRYRMGGGTSRFMPTFLRDNLLMYHNKKKMAPLCTYQYSAYGLIGIELKNIAVTYWLMCERHKKYTCGDLRKEVEMVCMLPEMQEILQYLTHDTSGLPGISPAMLRGDYDEVCRLIRQKNKKDRFKHFVKRLLFG